MKSTVSTPLKLFSVVAAVTVSAHIVAQAETPTRLGPVFKDEMQECFSAPPPNFELPPKGTRCEIAQVSDDGRLRVSLISLPPAVAA